MTKTVLVSFAILALATSAALAATQKKTYHHHAMKHHQAMKPTAAAPASPGMGASPGFMTGGVSKADQDMYVKNQRAAGLAGKK
jgi:hypothetical protein